jgi:hypothetical protein
LIGRDLFSFLLFQSREAVDAFLVTKREEPTQAPLTHFNPQHWLLCHMGLY